MIITFVRDDLQYNFYMNIEGVESVEEVEELLIEFKAVIEKEEDIYYSPEYFTDFLESHGIKARELSSMEVGQVYWGD
ncbi:hypothetical protein SAMN06265827_11067 [Orenia metallireducens]|uniref:Uncharacterized protein n=1 Tax=Orenia metallireducens TaxID=1413210 RepID=A0A285GUD3_9FIRM|nr:hypothetical protein [Orenia metallireducens]SNY26883.1 hypothetical protein SAMN06265827_11067 [Orenia metallireducens]